MKAVAYFLMNVWQAFFLGAWTAIWIVVALVMSIFSSEWPLALGRWVWGPALAYVGRYDMELVPGAQLNPRGPYVFIMNHQSMIDIPVAYSVIPVNLRFVAKKILKSVPFLGWYMWRTKMVFVDRKNRTQALTSLRRAGRQIRDGASILAYPEGTRSIAGEILPFKKGPFMVAIASQVPIVPVAVDGTHRVLARGGFKLRPGKVRIRIGEPIPTVGLKQRDLAELVRRVRDAVIDLHVSIGGMGGDKEDAIAPPGREGIERAPRNASQAA
ncbi:MAG: 1-acyl-sn-glycerol-3-phosphate acyltransferase [Myxococcales bacterium]|nr:1-acyl-sn-glycerol-3-phosphate acyltransferase [Myxococcales bacterium]